MYEISDELYFALKHEIEKTRYRVAYVLEAAIVEAIGEISPHPTFGESQKIYKEWCECEGGEITIARLVDLIIH